MWINGPIQTGQEYHIAYEGVIDTTSRRFYYWQRIRNFDADQVDTLLAITQTTDTVPVATQCRPTWFSNNRAHATDAAEPGLPVVIAGWFEAGGGLSRNLRMFPDPGSPTTDTPLVVTTTLDPNPAIAHQNRVVVFDQGSYSHGANSYVWTHNEDIWYTNANLTTLGVSSAITFGMENATGYVAVISTSYGELLMFKTQDGAVLVRGDITDPTVIRIPGIPPLGNKRHQPCTSPVGVAFLTETSGAWLWNGGESAENISYDAIDGDDFLITAQGVQSDFLDYYGRLWHWHDWIVFPNNWAWNFREQSWWRMEDPSTYRMMHVGPSPGNRLYTAPAYTDGTTAVIQGFDYNVPADSYRWTGQPFLLGIDREVKIRSVVLVGTGVGTVTLTFTKTDGTTSAVTCTLSSSSVPQFIRQNANVDCQNIQLQIDSVATTSNAPTVHEVRFGIQEGTHYPHGTA